jgi:hypothetical protein
VQIESIASFAPHIWRRFSRQIFCRAHAELTWHDLLRDNVAQTASLSEDMAPFTLSVTHFAQRIGKW